MGSTGNIVVTCCCGTTRRASHLKEIGWLPPGFPAEAAMRTANICPTGDYQIV